MARLSDLKLSYRLYMKAYRYRQFNWRPGASLTKPLSECRVAVVTTAAFYRPDQDRFDESVKGGDFSFRVIPFDTDLSTLRIRQKSDAFDAAGLKADKNLALPLDRLRELAREGSIGSVAERHFSFRGSIPAPGRLLAKTAPEVAAMLKEDHVDVVLLTPV